MEGDGVRSNGKSLLEEEFVVLLFVLDEIEEEEEFLLSDELVVLDDTANISKSRPNESGKATCESDLPRVGISSCRSE